MKTLSLLPMLIMLLWSVASASVFMIPVRKSKARQASRRRTLLEVLLSDNVGPGAYFVPLEVGTPPQLYNAVIDTGSGAVTMPCADFGFQIPIFQPSSSTTATAHQCGNGTADTACTIICGSDWPNTPCPAQGALPSERCSAVACVCSNTKYCQYGMLYGDGSQATGSIYTDLFRLVGSAMPPTNMSFGCAATSPETSYDENTFKASAPYLMGMNFQNGSFYSQLKNNGMIEPVLGFCLGDGTFGKRQTQYAEGFLVLGDDRPSNLNRYLVNTTEMIREESWPEPEELNPPGIWVQMVGLTLQGQEYVAQDSRIAMILDTGASGVVLPPSIFRPFLLALVAALEASEASTAVYYDVSNGLLEVEVSQAMSPSDLDAAFPAINVMMGPSDARINLPIPPSSYLADFSSNTQAAYMTVLSEGDRETRGIMGNMWMNHLFVRAEEDTKNLTFARVPDCSSLRFPAPPSPPSPPRKKKGKKGKNGRR